MNVLKTARVVVIDDIEKEAAPLLLSLSKFGIGAWYFTGNIEQLPPSPLIGVRIVFVDLRLGGADASREPRHKFAQTISVLDRIVGESKSTIGIVYWTKDEKDIEEFETQLEKYLPNFKPAFLKRIKKKLEIVESYSGNSSQLLESLGQMLQANFGCDLLQQWEQAVHDAVSLTSDRLSNLAHDDDGTADECMLKILAGLATSAGADRASTPPINVIRLFESLNPILSDHLEQLTLRKSDVGTSAVALKEQVDLMTGDEKSHHQLSEAIREEINGIVLTSRSNNDDPFFQPGAVYLPRPELGPKCPHHHSSMPIEELSESLLDHGKDPDFNKAYSASKAQKLTAEKQEAGKAEAESRFIKINSDCRKLLLEITPACDFAQGKRSTVRFLGGFLVPEEHSRLIRSGEYIRELEPVVNNELGGTWRVVFNSRYIFGISQPEAKLESAPQFRIRNPVLVDIITWLSGQTARPGYVSLR